MLKPLLLSGWYRVQPFFKYVVLVILISPLVAGSGHTSAKQAELAQVASTTEELKSVPEVASNPELSQELQATPGDYYLPGGFDPTPQKMAVAPSQPEVLKIYQIESSAEADESLSKAPANDSLSAVELAPVREEQEHSVSSSMSHSLTASQLNLIKRLKSGKIQSLAQADGATVTIAIAGDKSLKAAKTSPSLRNVHPSSNEAPNSQPLEEGQIQDDPLGSPHSIPWKWINATQESIGSKGRSGVRYYRSVPVSSPDGRYAVYSRVTLEVKPEMHNSRVTSALFIEDRQTKTLRVLTSTSSIRDPLLKAKLASTQTGTPGEIGVLVPVSWSQKGDRFLARKFEGVFSSADASDQAVIWDRQKNNTNSIAPAQEAYEHDTAILLGWSKTQPDQVLFRAGKLGDEDWPLMQVSSDGKTVTTNSEIDQPMTYGQKLTNVWGDPQVAVR
ncbi:MAG: hypothetical protein KME64_20105 [Scytonematopsis contorta HA4267-MV1]|jgi:hypothetical protein|nr:hypothetical protein [Scytonematopsis contorta HA4267-MV1]